MRVGGIGVSGGYVEEAAKAGGFGDQRVAATPGLGGGFEQLEHGGAFLALGVEGFAGDGGADLLTDAGRGELGVDKFLLDG